MGPQMAAAQGRGRPRRRRRRLLLAVVGLALALASGFYFSPRRVRPISDFPENAASIGWRTDGTGRYPLADPPVRWGPDTNVVWKTPMPGPGNASPVISGDRLFVCSEPTTLVCVSVTDGRILWHRSNNYDILAGGVWRAGKIARAVEEVTGRTRGLNLALYERHELRKKRRMNPADEVLRREIGRLTKRIIRLEKELENFEGYGFPGAHHFTGYSSPTAATNGKYVYALFGTVVLVCYDMEGNMQWARRLENPPYHWGVSASPLLVGRTLIVHVDCLRGIDATTGRDIWKVKIPWAWGTPVHARIGERDYVLTAAGNAVRVSDGRVLPATMSNLEFCAPVLDCGAVYYIEHAAKAYELLAAPKAALSARQLWQGRIKNDRYYASPVVHEGLVYAVTRGGVLSVLDAKTGRTAYERKLDLGATETFASVTMAGGYIYVSSEEGATLVLEAGPRYVEVARNELEPFRCCPVFSGGRMYVRAFHNLYCIGR